MELHRGVRRHGRLLGHGPEPARARAPGHRGGEGRGRERALALAALAAPVGAALGPGVRALAGARRLVAAARFLRRLGAARPRGGAAPAPGGRLRRPAVELSARQRPHGRARPPAPLRDSVGRRLPRPVGGASPPPPGHRLAPRRPGGPRAPGARGRGPDPRRLAHPRRFARRAPRPGVRGKGGAPAQRLRAQDRNARRSGLRPGPPRQVPHRLHGHVVADARHRGVPRGAARVAGAATRGSAARAGAARRPLRLGLRRSRRGARAHRDRRVQRPAAPSRGEGTPAPRRPAAAVEASRLPQHGARQALRVPGRRPAARGAAWYRRRGVRVGAAGRGHGDRPRRPRSARSPDREALSGRCPPSAAQAERPGRQGGRAARRRPAVCGDRSRSEQHRRADEAHRGQHAIALDRLSDHRRREA